MDEKDDPDGLQKEADVLMTHEEFCVELKAEPIPEMTLESEGAEPSN